MNAAFGTNQRKAILVLGMHRSGTSALTRVLNLLGVDISHELWPADEANKKGFWEDPRIFSIHDDMLGALGRSWHDLRDLPEGWLESEPAQHACNQLVELLADEFSESALWMVKDPRICRLLPLWKHVLRRLDVAPYAVLALRHPDEVAQSLKARNAHSITETRLAWLEHTAEAVYGSASWPRAVVSYDQLMGDWIGCVQRVEKELSLSWPVDLVGVQSAIEGFLSKDERHHMVKLPSNADANNLIDTLYLGMRKAADGYGWDDANSAASSYLACKKTFLDAMTSMQSTFDEQRRQWPEQFVGKVTSLAHEALTPVVSKQVIGLIEESFSARWQELMSEVKESKSTIMRDLQQSQSTIASLTEELQRSQLKLSVVNEERQRSQFELGSVNAELQRSQFAFDALNEELEDLKTKQQALVEELKQSRDEASSLVQHLQHANGETAALRKSTSWRLMAPFRFLVITIRSPRPVLSRVRFLYELTMVEVKARGFRFAVRKIIGSLRKRGVRGLLIGSAPDAILQARSAAVAFAVPNVRPAKDHLALRILIIAELSIPQCRKYRVTQKQEMIQQLGFDCTVVAWQDIHKCRNLLQTHSVAIFYRVPGFPEPLQIIKEAKALGVTTIWEVDDLIFDAEKYAGNSNLADLSDEMRQGVMNGAPLYKAAMLECDMGIASTKGLAAVMSESGVPDVFVVENALDKETIEVASVACSDVVRPENLIRIVYGSGTKTHDADFRVAAPAIKRVLQKRPHVRLLVIGELNLPIDYEEVADQVERLPLSDYLSYMKRLAACDINIAPLENSIFNDAKSNIKYLEASIVRLPSVCSPSAAFRSAIKNGNTGFLPNSAKKWEDSLLKLVDDKGFRERMAARAYKHVIESYTPQKIAENEVAIILSKLKNRPVKKRVLGVNIYFAPRSFGGATIVAEEIMRRLNKRDDWEYSMFTTLPATDVPAYELLRYEAAGADVFAMGLPPEGDPTLDYDNPASVNAFREALRAYQPDVVHFHCIQGIGASIAEVCKQENIPYMVTLHDAWWICGRQFMINNDNTYCFQTKIDMAVCASCVTNPKHNSIRQTMLRDVLMSASRLLAPSEFFRRLHVQNGFSPNKVVVNKNGIVRPKRAMNRSKLKDRPLCFGYVGGETPIKGAHLIREAFGKLPYNNYRLRVVDNMLNYGHHSIEEKQWSVPGELEIIPAYSQENIDDFFESIDVLLFPTQWKESFGLSVREALIRDVWVIATDAGGVVEDIVPGENGDIIPMRDDGTELATAIGRLLAEPIRLDGFHNPYAAQIRLFDEQADELVAYCADALDDCTQN